ncbi:hypothetical protein [Caudoviricetes sp.]|nr:hypothetical protein [Caudoviricetes sp.]
MNEEQAKRDETVAKRIQEKRKKIETHKQKSQERAKEVSDLRAAYKSLEKDPVIVDILTKAKTFASYHSKMAKDGIGARVTGRDAESGKDIVETVYLTSEQRIAELDQAKGLEQLIAYIERQFEIKPIAPVEQPEEQ